VSEFENLEKKAQAYVEEHPDQADRAINEVGEFADRETGRQHDEQIDRAVNAAEQYIGRDRGQGGRQQAQDGQTQQGSQN
jgi:hypothetical protein